MRGPCSECTGTATARRAWTAPMARHLHGRCRTLWRVGSEPNGPYGQLRRRGSVVDRGTPLAGRAGDEADVRSWPHAAGSREQSFSGERLHSHALFVLVRKRRVFGSGPNIGTGVREIRDDQPECLVAAFFRCVTRVCDVPAITEPLQRALCSLSHSSRLVHDRTPVADRTRRRIAVRVDDSQLYLRIQSDGTPDTSA